VVDGVAEARRNHEEQQRAIARHEADAGDRPGKQHVPGDQDAARPEPVDEETGRRLAEHRDEIERRYREPELPSEACNTGKIGGSTRM
jgi:hypothetical protein